MATKAYLSEAVYNRVGFSRKESLQLVEAVFDIIREELEQGQGEDVKISGFGNFMIRHKRARPGRNPNTGEETMITARKIVSFKPSIYYESM